MSKRNLLSFLLLSISAINAQAQGESPYHKAKSILMPKGFSIINETHLDATSEERRFTMIFEPTSEYMIIGFSSVENSSVNIILKTPDGNIRYADTNNSSLAIITFKPQTRAEELRITYTSKGKTTNCSPCNTNVYVGRRSTFEDIK